LSFKGFFGIVHEVQEYFRGFEKISGVLKKYQEFQAYPDMTETPVFFKTPEKPEIFLKNQFP
jgi:hypothetical protein